MTRFTAKFFFEPSIQSGSESCSGQSIWQWRGNGEWRCGRCCELVDMSISWHQFCKSMDLCDLGLASTYDSTQGGGKIRPFIGDNIHIFFSLSDTSAAHLSNLMCKEFYLLECLREHAVVRRLCHISMHMPRWSRSIWDSLWSCLTTILLNGFPSIPISLPPINLGGVFLV